MRNTLFLALPFLAIFGTGAFAASTTIEQSGQKFSERAVDIQAGDTIVFANHDDVTHNISLVDETDDATDLGLQKPGSSVQHAFDKTGRFKVRCSIHPGMKMVVTVK